MEAMNAEALAPRSKGLTSSDQKKKLQAALTHFPTLW